MANSSLGIFIDKEIIKYAKLHKEKDSIKVESFSVEFYEKGNLAAIVKKIISETNASKIPIDINISNELYNYFEAFSMLNKKDLKDSIDIEFDLLCGEKGYNRKSLEPRHILINSQDNKDKFKVLHIAANKNDIANREKAFAPVKITTMTPISTSIVNLVDIDKNNDDFVIVNIEKETQITTIVDGQIFRADIIADGMGKILKIINEVESSTKKSYEMCKNMTVYSQGQGSAIEGNEYVGQVTPILDNIIKETKEIMETSFTNIKKVYITGAGAIINNVDLYFQENMPNCSCEILKPYFLETSSVKIPIKEYIEVNSAIALGLNSMGELNKELNFAAKAAVEADVKDVWKKVSDKIGIKKSGSGAEPKTQIISKADKLLMRICVLALTIYLTYSLFSNYAVEQMAKRNKELEGAIAQAEQEISKISDSQTKIQDATSTYSILLDNLQKLNSDVNSQEINRVIEKNAIPNFLNKIMVNIPKRVQITSIENTEDKHIVIEIQSKEYEQLGYFMAAIKSNNILENVKSTSGQRDGDTIKIILEGDLP